jgi:hypothetical protein
MSAPRRADGPRGAPGAVLCTLLALALCLRPLPAAAQGGFSAEEIKAAFVYRFTSYVRWPGNAAKAVPFIIAVQCADPIADALEQIVRGKEIEGQPVQVLRLNDLRELDGAQVLYVGAGCIIDRQRELDRLAGKPVLVITDESDGLQGAGIINFLTIGDHVRFEVSMAAAKRSHLTISSDLLSVAVRVIGGVHSLFRCYSTRVSSDFCPGLLARR